jgi:hypothetical protein
MSFQFGGCLFDTEHKFHRAIAQEWLTAGGWNYKAEIQAALDNLTPEQLAKECLDGWWSGNNGDIPDAEELIAAFRELATDRVWLELV